MGTRRIKVTGVVRKGQGLVSPAIRATEWAKHLHPGSINLYVEGDQPGRGHDAVGCWRLHPPPAMPPGLVPCTVNGTDGWIINVHRRQTFNAPVPGKAYTMFEIVARLEIHGVKQDAELTLEYDWQDTEQTP